MAETKAKTPRKPRTKVAKPEEPVILNEEELLKDPNMKSEDPEASFEEVAAANPEIMEMQGIPEDKVSEVAESSLNEEKIKSEALYPEVLETQGVPEDRVPEVTESSEEIADLAETEDEPNEEIAEKEEELVEKENETSGELASEAPASTELPENVTPFNDYSPKKIAAEICKLNPNLADGQSKWLARVTFNGASHKIFKGSYAKALNAAKNYNILHGMPDADIKKVRN